MQENTAGICYLFAAAPINDYRWIRLRPTPQDLILCADGGIVHAKALGLTPGLAVGDFDSCKRTEFDFQTMQFPPEKDDTDFMIALKAGLSKGYREFQIYGALGGRLDHTLGNIQGMSFLKDHGANGVLLDEKNQLRMLEKETCSFPRPDAKVTLLSFSDRCVGVTTRGLQYPLKDAVLTSNVPLGVSNEFTGDIASVTVREGKLLLLFSKD